MELDEIEKRIEWLDSERKKTNQQIKNYKDRITQLEGVVEKQQQNLAVFGNDIKSAINASNRLAQFDEVLAQYKSDLLKKLTESEKKQANQSKASEKSIKLEISQINSRFDEIQSFVPLFTEVKKNLQNRIDEETRIAQRVDTLEHQTETISGTFNDFLQSNKKTVDDLQIESKRLSDVQIELLAIRKRIDEARNHGEENSGVIKRVEERISAIETGEVERKLNQTAFNEKISLAQLERERIWKEWQNRFDEINSLGDNFQSKIDALESTHLAIKKSQSELDDVNLRFDRRINELTEMHRLTEERFRQEWISFKSEDQKRWTNYSLTQDEKDQDDNRQMTKLLERLEVLEDATQEARDTIELINEETEKRMKGFLSVLHDLMESFNQTFNKR